MMIEMIKSMVNIMKAVIIAPCLICLSINAALSQRQDGQVNVLRSDERSLVFEYRPRFLPEQIVRDGNMELKVIDFVGSIPIRTGQNTGAPDIRYEALPLGFPAQNGNAVQVIAADYEDVSGVTLAPVPTMREADEMAQVARYKINPERYAVASFIPAQVAELLQPTRARTMQVGSVKLFPVQFNPSTRTIRKYTRLVVEVVYGASNRQRVQNEDDRMFDGVLLNYTVARNWKFAEQAPLRRANVVPSVLATGAWYRLAVVDEGVYILNAAYLRAAGINLSTIDPRKIKIYGNGGTEVPENLAVQRPTDLVENAVYVEGEGDGRFDEGDYVLFFAKSVRNWQYNSSSHLLDHYLNHYSDQNYYWLTIGDVGSVDGKRMAVQPSPSDSPVAFPTKFLDMVLVEEELFNLLTPGSGKEWFGRSYIPPASFTYPNLLPGLVPNDNITYRFRLIARSNISPSFTVRENGALVGTGTFGLGTVYYEDPETYASEGTFTVVGTSNLPNNTSRLSFAFASGSVSATGWNDWIEIQYPRKFEAVNNSYLRFRSPDNVTGTTQYTLEQFTSLPFIFNVTQPENVRRITGAVGTYAFRAQETAGQVSEYCASSASGFKQPAAVLKIANQNLHGDITGANFIIVTSAEFRTTADRLKDYRTQPAHGGLQTVVVDVNQIYNEFGGGLPDVAAIRDFIKLAYDTWSPRPRFVMFLGQASYDYKGILGARSSYVPTWQSLQSLDGVYSYSTDDFFVKFAGNDRPSLTTGRVNARTVAEADAFLAKLMRYEDGSARDSWKMRMLFIGDDGWTDQGEVEGILHSEQVEQLATYYTPNEFEKRKIYIAEYPTVQTAQGRRKPGAYQAIIDQVNEGMLVTNFTGHGNPLQWAHENIFNVQTTIPQLVNTNRLSVFFAATCNFSEFDDPRRYTGSELLLNKPDGGAIGAISATRKVYSGENAYLHQGIFANMFRRDQFGRLIVERPATAIYLFKSTGANSVNDQKYFFMGDPTMKLQFPIGYASLDSINHQSVLGNIAQLKALARVSLQGTVRDLSNQPDTTFNGRMLLTVNDASRQITIINFAPGLNWPYLGSGATIYRGQNSISRGRFDATFVVPKDISYADSTSFGRLVVYFLDPNGVYDGEGFRDSLRIGGTEVAVQDTTGPNVTIYLGSRGFRDGDMVGEDPTLFVDLVDSNGINTSVSGIGHRIEAWVNGGSQSKDITDYYSSQLDDYQKGTVQYQLKGLPQGKNTVRVRAWDTHNNAAVKETFFDVTSTDQLRVTDVFNYPNPFAGGTTFTFRQNLLTPLNVTVKIYTLAGRLIQTLDAISPGEPFIKVPWDGRDRDGDILANGVYLYKVIVRTTEGRFGSEVLGKLSVLK